MLYVSAALTPGAGLAGVIAPPLQRSTAAEPGNQGNDGTGPSEVAASAPVQNLTSTGLGAHLESLGTKMDQIEKYLKRQTECQETLQTNALQGDEAF